MLTTTCPSHDELIDYAAGKLPDNAADVVADHLDSVVRRLKKKPAIVGHSFGGLIAQKLAGRGLASVTVAVDPAPFRGVLRLPRSAITSVWPVLGSAANRRRAN